MTKDPAISAADSALGKAKEPAGTAARSPDREPEATAKPDGRKLRAAYDKVKEVLKNSRHT